MGQKTNPIGNRLGIIRGWDSNWYGGRNYGDKLAEDDKLEEIFASQYDLQEFLAPSNFKSYDELKTRLDIVLSGTVVAKTAETIMDEPVAPVVDTTPVSAPDTTNEEDDDTMSYFSKLAEDE